MYRLYRGTADNTCQQLEMMNGLLQWLLYLTLQSCICCSLVVKAAQLSYNAKASSNRLVSSCAKIARNSNQHIYIKSSITIKRKTWRWQSVKIVYPCSTIRQQHPTQWRRLLINLGKTLYNTMRDAILVEPEVTLL